MTTCITIPAAIDHAAVARANWDNAQVQPGSRADRIEITLLPNLRGQTVAGFGGAFSAIGGECLQLLPTERREALLRELYGEEGAAFSFCRTPIGASDFARRAYSLADDEAAFDPQRISLDPDRAHLLPWQQAAVRVNPRLRFHASPWSPPAWMKRNADMCNGGGLKDGRAVREALAGYLAGYVAACARAGVTIARLLLQNELDVTSRYPSCPYALDDFAAIQRDLLTPELRRRGLACEPWGGTIRGIAGPQALELLAIPGFAASVAGLGVQYLRSDLLHALRRHHPDVRLMHTESVCHDGGNTWEQAVALFHDIITFLRGGCDTFSYWNTLLPEDGLSGWGWRQNALVTVDRATLDWRTNPDFQVMRLLSRSAPSGSVVVESISFQRPTIAFARPDGRLVALVFNPEERSMAVQVHCSGRTVRHELPPRSIAAVDGGGA